MAGLVRAASIPSTRSLQEIVMLVSPATISPSPLSLSPLLKLEKNEVRGGTTTGTPSLLATQARLHILFWHGYGHGNHGNDNGHSGEDAHNGTATLVSEFVRRGV